jgi:hypothetical protein
MQLTGPPRLNGWETPRPSYQTPLDAAFRRDGDMETSIKYRDGSKRRVGPCHYRLRVRLAWAAITYDLAHAILSAVSKEPVMLVPRTRRSGDPSYLSEQSYDCELISDLPATTPLYRRGAGGDRLAKVEIELRALNTVQQLPDAITGGVDQVTP